ncbi:pectinesterase family protein [Paenibacillus filicis]|uniref:Pectinesterase family protein n=1 Tax=Paenibacillus gyeongsangnamensis TaxID=3388067 RepID=A0ABT4QBE7_9BACL|nr:pectinesterase family protein [Paenibacillus filicis]MCZ8514209.1 pectinesterase family protein [Paenibacillus filicis]
MAGNDFRAERLTIANDAGWGEPIGQALAVYASGERTVLEHCRLLGNQDTLYTAKGRQYYKHCLIEGHVDFIFGAATAVFDRCEIRSLRQGYIAAPSTEERTLFGYVFLDCRLAGTAAEETVYLARPWRRFGQTLFVRTWMGAHIRREGWDNWRDPGNERTARFGEYGSSGAGAHLGLRAPWARLLSAEEAADLTPERIFSGPDGWVPTAGEDRSG